MDSTITKTKNYDGYDTDDDNDNSENNNSYVTY